MKTCKAIGRDLLELSRRGHGELPDWVRDHVAACPGCNRRLAAARLSHALVASTAQAALPSEGFADTVRTALAARDGRRQIRSEVWRPAWGLVPTFAAAVAALCIVYESSPSPSATPGLFPTDELSAGENLVLDTSAPDMDDVLAAVLEGAGR